MSRNERISFLRNKAFENFGLSRIERIELEMLEELRDIDRRYYTVD